MTRRGSLAYYLVAWVCGGFFFTLTYYLRDLAKGASHAHVGRDFLALAFYLMMLGFVPQLLVAFYLRRLTTRFDWHSAWQWMTAGAALLLAALWVLARVGLLLIYGGAIAKWIPLAALLFAGPILAQAEPLWLGIPPGVATAYLLYRVHCAFEPATQPTGSDLPQPASNRTGRER